MGQTAENVAEQYGVSRDDQDAFALRSQQKAAAARSAGRFADEIAPVDDSAARRATPKRVDQDEFIRPDTTLEVLAKLKPAFRTDGKGSVTAGNSSGLNDGAARCSSLPRASRVSEFGLEPWRVSSRRGRRRRAAHHGDGPGARDAHARSSAPGSRSTTIGRDRAERGVRRAVARVPARARPRRRRSARQPERRRDRARPSARHARRAAAAHRGARARRRAARYALCTMCIGVGQGMATIIERV